MFTGNMKAVCRHRIKTKRLGMASEGCIRINGVQLQRPMLTKEQGEPSRRTAQLPFPQCLCLAGARILTQDPGPFPLTDLSWSTYGQQSAVPVAGHP